MLTLNIAKDDKKIKYTYEEKLHVQVIQFLGVFMGVCTKIE